MASYSGNRSQSPFSTNQWNDRSRAGSRYDTYNSDYEDDSQYDGYRNRASSSSVHGLHSSNMSQYSSGYRSDTCDYRLTNQTQQKRNIHDVNNTASDRYVYSRPPLYSGNTNQNVSSNNWHYRTRSASNSRQQQSQSSISKQNPQVIVISYDEFDDHYDDHVKIIDEQSFNGYRTTIGSLSSSPIIRQSYSYCSHASSNPSVHIDLTCATMTIDGDELEDVEKIDLVHVVDDDDDDDCSCTLPNDNGIHKIDNITFGETPDSKETIPQGNNRSLSNHSKTKNYPKDEFKTSTSYYVPPSEMMDFAEVCLMEDSYPSMPSLTHENVNTDKRNGYVNNESKETDINDKEPEQPELDDEEETSESPILEADESFVTDSYVGESTGTSAELDEETFAENVDTVASMDIEDNDTTTEDQSYTSNDKMSLILKRLLDDEDEDDFDESNESFDKVTTYRKNIVNNSHGNFRNKLSTIHSLSDHTGTTTDERSDKNYIDSASDTAIAPVNGHYHHTNEQHTIVSDCGNPDEVLDNDLRQDEILVYDRDPFYPTSNENESHVPVFTNSITIVVDGTNFSQSGISFETPPLVTENDARDCEEEDDDGEEEEENVDEESHTSTVSSINLKVAPEPLNKTVTKKYSNKALPTAEVQVETKVPSNVSTPASTIHRSTSTLSDDSMDTDDEDDEESEYEDVDDEEESVSNYDSNCATPAPHTRDLLIEAQQFKLERQQLNETINRLKQMVSVKNDDLEILGDQLRRAVMTQCELVMASAELEELKSSQAMIVEASISDETRQQQQNIQELKKQNYTLLEDYSVKEKELLTEIITLSNKLKDYDTITYDKIEEIERKHRNEILEKDFLIAQLTVELQTSKMKYQSLKEQSKTKLTIENNNDGKQKQQQQQQKSKSKHKVKVKTNIKKIFHTQW